MKNATKTIAILAAVALTSLPVFAQGRGNGKGKHEAKEQQEQKEKKEQKVERSRNRDDDDRILHQYFSNNASLPPGLAKRKSLPPGLERQLQLNGTLPPGLAKRGRAVPVTLTRQLVVLPASQRRVIIGNQLVVLDRANRILDLFLLP